jgi:outer membrane lipoprotein-sorting protein
MNDANEQKILQRIRPTQRVAASNSFRERVMRAIVDENARASSQFMWRYKSWPRWLTGWVTVGCAAVLLLLLLPMLPRGRGVSKSPGVALLAQSVEAMSNVQSVHITGRIRTLPNDNFELIGVKYDFVPVSIWREYTDPPRWRVEKPGRVVVMDGKSSLLYISSSNSAMTGSTQPGFIEWLRPMLDPQSILENELAAARQGAAQATVSEADGVTTVAVRRQARGDFANDWARNKSIPESDHTCVYRFDSESKRLEGVQVVVSAGGSDTVVAEFTEFRYNEVFPQSLFTVPLPADVNWMTEPSTKPAQLSLNGPKEAATYFFDALAHEDWDSVLQVISQTKVPPVMKEMYGGLQLISIGEPFQSGLYPGYFVPYQVRLRDGSTRTFKLAVRNDNPAHRWMIDGGY